MPVTRGVNDSVRMHDSNNGTQNWRVAAREAPRGAPAVQTLF